MNVLGKILVFVNLVFSLVTAGLIVMAYSTRTNWNAQYTKLTAAYSALGASARADVQAAERSAETKDTALKAEARARQDVENQLKSAKEETDRVRNQYAELQRTQTGAQTNLQDLTNELAKRKTEVENFLRLLDQKEKKISDQDLQMTRLRDEAVKFRIQWEQARDRNADFQKQNQTLMTEVAQLRQQLGGGTSRPAIGQAVPSAPENLKGTIQDVKGELATITPGSDAGVKVGQKLAVFRLYPQPDYLGDIEILRATPHEAVGRLSGTKWRQIKKGDDVAADLLGGR